MNFLRMHEKVFQPLQYVHENMHAANVTPLNPLTPGHFIIALRPGKLQEIMFGEVLTMYAKPAYRGAKHEWIESAKSVGIPSYISIQVYCAFTGNTMSSVAWVPIIHAHSTHPCPIFSCFLH